MKGLRAALAAAAVVFWVAGAAAQGKAEKSCDCDNLESLQQEVENAEYLVKAFEELVEQLKEIESHEGEGYDVDNRAGHAYADAQANSIPAGLPHASVKDNTGPGSVEMRRDTCEQNAADLERLRAGSPCKEIADIVLEHEAQHRALCQQMGARAYWEDRKFSELAAEELERYRQQARAMRDALRAMLDNSELTMQGETEMNGKSPEFDGTWVIESDTAVLARQDYSGGARWKLKGSTTGSNRMTKAIIGGMACTPSGSFQDEIEFEIETDGLTVSATHRAHSTGGQMAITCQRGWGMSMQPRDTSIGTVFQNRRLVKHLEVVVDVNTTPLLTIFEGNSMKVTGTYVATLICKPR